MQCPDHCNAFATLIRRDSRRALTARSRQSLISAHPYSDDLGNEYLGAEWSKAIRYYLEIYVDSADDLDFRAESDAPFTQPLTGALIDPAWRADRQPCHYFDGDRLEVIRVEHRYRNLEDTLVVFCNPMPTDDD